MAAIVSNEGAYQEIRYIRIPDRRLISGLLYVNVISHIEHDNSDDFFQQCFDHNPPNGTLHSNIFVNQGGDQSNPTEKGREGFYHSFADYDCFVFYVAGGMTLRTGNAAPIGTDTYDDDVAGMVSDGYAEDRGSGVYSWKDTSVEITTAEKGGTWYENGLHGDYCQHFIKHHLISRINNAAGHAQTTTDEYLFKGRPMLRKQYRQYGNTDGSTVGDGDLYSPNAPVVSNEFILSEGVYDHLDTLNDDLGPGSIVRTETGNTNNDIYDAGPLRANIAPDGTTSLDTGNTYFSPVDKVRIYGKHQFTEDIHYKNPDDGNFVSNMNRGVRAVHETTFWDLVVDVGMRGNNPSGSAGTHNAATKDIIKTQMNVAFHPFGETADFSISDTEHTS